MNEELKPCPFCGVSSEFLAFDSTYTKAREVIVVCGRCAAHGPGGSTWEIAEYHWNTRPGSEEVARLRAMAGFADEVLARLRYGPPSELTEQALLDLAEEKGLLDRHHQRTALSAYHEP